jgi:hypothetical protein
MKFLTQRVEIAVHERALVAYRRDFRDGALWTRETLLHDRNDLRNAFEELRDAMKLRSPAAALALMPPIAPIRRIRMPPLHSAEMRRVLARDASRYFVTDGATQIARGVRVPRARTAPSFVMACATSAQLITDLYSAATENQWRVESCVPATSAWCAAASSIWPQARKRALVIVEWHDKLILLASLNGIPVGIRHGLNEHTLVDAVVALGTTLGASAPTVLFVPRERRAALMDALADTRVVVLGADPRSFDPPRVAARFARQGRALELEPDSASAARDQYRRRGAAITAIVAAALFIGALLLNIVHIRSQLASTVASRSGLHEQAVRAVRLRGVVNAIDDRLSVLSTLEGNAPTWTNVISRLADRLPHGAYLTELRGDTDSLTLQGVTRDSAGVVESLRSTPGVSSVRLVAPIQRDSAMGANAQGRRFAVVVHFRPLLTPVTVPAQ